MKYIFIAFVFISCNSGLLSSDTPPISTDALDTIKSSQAKPNANPALFETAFIKGTIQNVNGTNVALYGVTIGKLKVSSGRIIACDPMHIDEYGRPFTQLFPRGEFPVQLSIAKFDKAEEVAFARINFSDRPVVKWAFALLEGQSQIPLGSEKIYGYSTDAGVGVFIDDAAYKALDFKATVYNMNGTVYQEMDKHYRNDWRYAVYNFGNHDLAAFTSGEGDGYYATYIGYDANGQPCRLVTDFRLFDWSESKNLMKIICNPANSSFRF